MQSHTKTQGAIWLQHGCCNPVVREESMPYYSMKFHSHGCALKGCNRKPHLIRTRSWGETVSGGRHRMRERSLLGAPPKLHKYTRCSGKSQVTCTSNLPLWPMWIRARPSGGHHGANSLNSPKWDKDICPTKNHLQMFITIIITG